jgi:ribonuclease VapC
MVVDTSALIAVLFEEAHAQWVAARLTEYVGRVKMSTVNLAEALILIRDRQPTLYGQLEAQILSSGIVFVPPDAEQARIASAARLEYPLNLGDCFAYALAVTENDAILTLDRDFTRTNVRCLIPKTRAKR